jgi:hypothetical protein
VALSETAGRKGPRPSDVVTLVGYRGPEPARGIPDPYTRIPIGLENTADIIADFQQALV